MNCFQITDDGKKEMTLACKSKEIKILFYICTFRKLSKTNTNLLKEVKQEWFFLVRRKESQGSSSVIHYLNKH